MFRSADIHLLQLILLKIYPIEFLLVDQIIFEEKYNRTEWKQNTLN